MSDERPHVCRHCGAHCPTCSTKRAAENEQAIYWPEVERRIDALLARLKVVA